MDDVERKQLKEHIQTLEWVKAELLMQLDALKDRIFKLEANIKQTKEKLK
jgi:predicted  nucleic acid-binding Zn-ribbon protein